MRGGGGFLLASALLVLLCLPYAVPAVAAQAVSKSQHILVFGGSAWGSVLEKKGAEVQRAIVEDVGPQLLRKYAFVTIINVSSLQADKHLEARLTVLQAPRSNSSGSHLLHIWPPDEVNSMINQCAFKKTLAIHTPSEEAHLISVRTPELGERVSAYDVLCTRLIVLGTCTIAAMTFCLLILLFWMCCHCCCGGSEHEYELYHMNQNRSKVK
ncbi:uncharacterized protein Tco025E_01942 [Trypanosoma conorhini]|uniref:Uncharacterized protein n=1 Tax=Trypanosoma conorhini TaxID=83891 RepID=A0A422Q7A3_9TRYP|nr:uncharacterized protein Tco025E_01942 [Trypanosoma conorhini]RNF25842.1 hypothetical protein Tco025E_01942 [Trypanosoma conorhini]